MHSPSRTEFFSSRYSHNIGPPNDEGSCMHVNTDNSAKPEGLFSFLTNHVYETGLFGKVTNDQSNILNDLVKRKAVTYIDSPIDYNSYDSRTWFHFENGKNSTEILDRHDPVYNTTYQTAQIGNRTLKWLETVVGKTDQITGERIPFFAYLGPRAPHYPAEPARWYQDTFPTLTIPITPNYNYSCAKKASHVAQNPPLSELARCWCVSILLCSALFCIIQKIHFSLM